MSTATPSAAPAPAPPAATPSEAQRTGDWMDHVARTTAVLAVLAALSSGQYAGQFSRTILAQAEATDQWSFYQAKSIKRSLKQGQIDVMRAVSVGRPEIQEAIKEMEKSANDKLKEYELELAQIKVAAEQSDLDKRTHQKQGDRFQIAFILLQVGVVLSTIAASAKRRELWVFAIVAGVIGLVVVVDGFLLLV